MHEDVPYYDDDDDDDDHRLSVFLLYIIVDEICHVWFYPMTSPSRPFFYTSWLAIRRFGEKSVICAKFIPHHMHSVYMYPKFVLGYALRVQVVKFEYSRLIRKLECRRRIEPFGHVGHEQFRIGSEIFSCIRLGFVPVTIVRSRFRERKWEKAKYCSVCLGYMYVSEICSLTHRQNLQMIREELLRNWTWEFGGRVSNEGTIQRENAILDQEYSCLFPWVFVPSAIVRRFQGKNERKRTSDYPTLTNQPTSYTSSNWDVSGRLFVSRFVLCVYMYNLKLFDDFPRQ